MKLKIQFGREIRFDLPIRHGTRSRLPWLPGVRVFLRMLALAQRPKPVKPERADGNCLKDSTP